MTSISQLITEPGSRAKVPVGRAVKTRKRLVTEVTALDILDLKEAGFLTTSCKQDRVIAWFDRRPTTVRVQFENEEPQSAVFRCEGEERVYKHYCQLVRTPCHFGGSRLWFLCPFEENDSQPCHRRSRILYVTSEGLLGCRECLQLTYACRQRHRDWRYELVEKPMKRLRKAAQAVAGARQYGTYRKALLSLETAKRTCEMKSQQFVGEVEIRMLRVTRSCKTKRKSL